MGSLSNFLEDEIQDHILGGADYARPATVYIALFTVTPSDTGGGTECTGGSYARLAVTNNATNWPASSGGAKANGTEFALVAASASWGTVVAFGIFDALTVGNLMWWGDITPNKLIDTGDVARFPIGDLDLTLA